MNVPQQLFGDHGELFLLPIADAEQAAFEDAIEVVTLKIANLEQERAQLRQLMLGLGYREPTGEEQRRQNYKESIAGLRAIMREGRSA
jgi:hypothetical protein